MWPLLFSVLGLGLLAPALGQDLFLASQQSERDVPVVVAQNMPSDTQRPLQTGEMRVRTVNYNVFGRWTIVTGLEGQDERLQAIPEAIKAHPRLGADVDLITVEEAWCPDNQWVAGRVMCGSDHSRAILIDAFQKHGWPHHTNVVDKPGSTVVKKPTNGGVLIFSRWPILATSQYVFDACTGSDCNAAKGAVYVRIKKTENGVSQVINVLASHLQAWSTPIGRETRKGQLREIRDKFLPAVGIPTDGSEVLLFQGDMNTDFVLTPEMVDFAEATLSAELPPIVGTQLFSSDPSTNWLVGKDGAAEMGKCFASYKTSLNVGKSDTGVAPVHPTASCSNIPKTTAAGGPIKPIFLNKTGGLNVGEDCKAYCPCCPHEMLDFITYSAIDLNLQPSASSMEIIPLKSVKPLTYKWSWCAGADCLIHKQEAHDITGNELSDHYPVVANFIFRPTTQSFPLLDGCKEDSDCHFKLSVKASCYCDGPGCTWHNKTVYGWGAGANHPVNANCQFHSSDTSTCFCRPGDH